jgi:hypothetical protein
LGFKNKFDGGEIDKWGFGAVDDPAYQRGAAWLENFTVLGGGGLNRRRGYKYVSRILLDAADGAVKLIPYQVDERTNYLIYISASKYGCLRFDGGDMVDSREYSWPAPPVIRPENVVGYKITDPDAYYEISDIRSLSSENDVLETGDVLEVGGLTMMESARLKVLGVVPSELGKIEKLSSLSLIPAARLFNGELSQEKTAVCTGDSLEVSYFDEEGAGTGLIVQCSCEKKDEEATLSFTVLDPGYGFKADKNKASTTLRLSVEQLGIVIVKAAVSGTGGIASINDYKIKGFPQYIRGVPVMRWLAEPPPPDVYSDVKDCMQRAPEFPPNIKIWVNEAEIPAEKKEFETLDVVYEITFGEETSPGSKRGSGNIAKRDGGRGFVPSNWMWLPEPPEPPPDPGAEESALIHAEDSDSASGDDPDPPPPPPYYPPWPEKPKCFLEIYFVGELSDELCERVLRCVADIDSEGSITKIEPIRYWVDDDLVLKKLPEAKDPYAPGGVFSMLRTAESFWEAYPPPPPPPPPAKEGEEPDPDPPEPDPEPPDPDDGSWAAGCVVFANILENFAPYLGYQAALFRGDWDMDVYTAEERRNMGDDACGGRGMHAKAYRVFRPFHGTWYRADMIISGNKNIPSYSEFAGAEVQYAYYNWNTPVMRWPLQKSSWKSGGKAFYPVGDKNNTEWVYFFQYNGSGCPKTVADKDVSPVPYVHWFDPENNFKSWTAPLKYRMERMPISAYGFNLLERWYIDDPANGRDDDANIFTTLADAQTRMYSVERAEAYKGAGAVLRVETSYQRPRAEGGGGGVLYARIEETDPGAGYMSRDIDNINLYLWYSRSGDKYKYTIPVIADRGTDGMLVLKKPDGSSADIDPVSGRPYVVYEVDARLLTPPPADGQSVSLVDGEDSLSVVCAVSAVENGGFIDKWDVDFIIERSPEGRPLTAAVFKAGQMFDVSWKAENEFFGVPRGVEVLEIVPVLSYLTELLSKGRFKRDPGGTVYYGKSGGVDYVCYTGGSRYVSETVLYGVQNPNSYVYKVLKDETMSLFTSYWVWLEGAWTEKIIQVFPSMDEQVNALQYAFTGVFFIVCGAGITPFTLKIDGGDLVLGAVGANTAVAYDITKDNDCGLLPQNVVVDENVPVYFMRSVLFSPGVAAYINGRLWVSGLPSDPSRVFVSKPQADKDRADFDFSTYKIFVTVAPKFTPFTAKSEMKSNMLSRIDNGVLGLMLVYAQNPRKASKGAKVDFGFDYPFIVATPYFTSGANVVSLGREVELSKPSKPLPNEYTESAAEMLRSKTANKMAVARMRVTIPGGGCVISADCDGFEARVVNWHAMIGTSNSTGPVTTGQVVCEWTAWGDPYNAAGVIASATAAAVVAAWGLNSIPVGFSAAGILSAAYVVVYNLLKQMMSEIKLTLTDGSSADASLDELGMAYETVDGLRAKCEYLLAKNRLYETKQPFVMREWVIEEREYSTAECGFTFKFSSEQTEGLSFISDVRNVFAGTDSSERVIPFDVDGASQSSRISSFFGAEKIQCAKGGSAVYFLQKGGGSLMRAAYELDAPVPSVVDVQRSNKEIFRGRRVLSIKSSKSLPVSVWCVMNDGTAAVLSEQGGASAWSRVSTEAGMMLDTAALNIKGVNRFVAVKNDLGVYIAGIAEDPGVNGDVFLDLWQEYLNISLCFNYTANAVVYDSTARTIESAGAYPEAGAGKFIGYLFMSRFRSLPVDSAMALKPARVARARFRFVESHLPFIRGFPSGSENRLVSARADEILKNGGIVDVPVPGNIENDAAFELYSDIPLPLSVLCLMTEEDVN